MLGCGPRLGSVMAEVDFELPQGLPLRALDGQAGTGNHMSHRTRLRLRTEARLDALGSDAT